MGVSWVGLGTPWEGHKGKPLSPLSFRCPLRFAQDRLRPEESPCCWPVEPPRILSLSPTHDAPQAPPGGTALLAGLSTPENGRAHSGRRRAWSTFPGLFWN